VQAEYVYEADIHLWHGPHAAFIRNTSNRAFGAVSC